MHSGILHIAFSLFSIFRKTSSTRKPNFIDIQYFLIEVALWKKMENNEKFISKISTCMLFLVALIYKIFVSKNYIFEKSPKIFKKIYLLIFLNSSTMVLHIFIWKKCVALFQASTKNVHKSSPFLTSIISASETALQL